MQVFWVVIINNLFTGYQHIFKILFIVLIISCLYCVSEGCFDKKEQLLAKNISISLKRLPAGKL